MRLERRLGRVGGGGGALLIVGLFFLFTSGCAGWEPFAPPLQREMREGPGLFSGPDGEFVLERSAPRAGDGEEEEKAEKALGREEDRP